MVTDSSSENNSLIEDSVTPGMVNNVDKEVTAIGVLPSHLCKMGEANGNLCGIRVAMSWHTWDPELTGPNRSDSAGSNLKINP